MRKHTKKAPGIYRAIFQGLSGDHNHTTCLPMQTLANSDNQRSGRLLSPQPYKKEKPPKAVKKFEMLLNNMDLEADL
jgi:hypothetical protein